MIETESGVVHYLARCIDCEWFTDDYRTGEEDAKLHVDQTGHTVNYELGINGTIKQNSGEGEVVE